MHLSFNNAFASSAYATVSSPLARSDAKSDEGVGFKNTSALYCASRGQDVDWETNDRKSDAVVSSVLDVALEAVVGAGKMLTRLLRFSIPNAHVSSAALSICVCEARRSCRRPYDRFEGSLYT